AVLRSELKAQRVSRIESRTISKLVFAYFRWLGWMDEANSTADKLRAAVEWNERFRREPGSFPDDELRLRSVPAWIHDYCEPPIEFFRELQREPRVWLRAKNGPELARKLGDCRLAGEGVWQNTLEYTGEQDLFRTPEFHAGEFELQDISSQ